MPRQKRDDFPGAWHHVMHRGARRAPIFKLSEDCFGFLHLLQEMVERFNLEVHAYSLMPNHYHLLIRSPLGNLSRGMQYLNGTYTLWLNARHNWDGPVFRGRFRSQLVANEEHLRILLGYIHLNPVKARLVHRLTDEAWTSHRAYIGKEQSLSCLSTVVLLDLFGGAEKLNEFVVNMRQGTIRYPEDFNPETGLFKKRVLVRTQYDNMATAEREREKSKLVQKYTRQRPAADVLKEVLEISNATLDDLKRREIGPGANPARRFAIWALNRSSELTQREISHMLEVPYHQVTRFLGRLRREHPAEPLAGWVKNWLSREGTQVSSAGA